MFNAYSRKIEIFFHGTVMNDFFFNYHAIANVTFFGQSKSINVQLNAKSFIIFLRLPKKNSKFYSVYSVTYDTALG